MMKPYYLLFALAALTACMPASPVISEYNGSSVKIQTSAFATAEDQKMETQAEATRICGKVGKRAEYASTITNSETYTSEHLYLCL